MNPIVSVLILTYNHKRYISEAIESVLQQKTNFEFEILIGDDCSTDGTRSIVEGFQKQYPEKIQLINSITNVGSIRNEKRLMDAAIGKYIALLEGDDFWINPMKLQKQVDFLEENQEYGLVHGDVNHYYEKSGKIVRSINKTAGNLIPTGSIFNSLLCPDPFFIKTATTCFRRDLVVKYFDYDLFVQNDWQLSDLALWMDISFHSKVHYIDEVHATYRLLNESGSRSKDINKKIYFNQKLLDLKCHYVDKYQQDESLKLEFENRYYRSLLLLSRKIKNKNLLGQIRSYFKRYPSHLNSKEKIYLSLIGIKTFELKL
jgi:glycosyltransferase involved in cell wall biosynthesis